MASVGTRDRRELASRILIALMLDLELILMAGGLAWATAGLMRLGPDTQAIFAGLVVIPTLYGCFLVTRRCLVPTPAVE